MAKKRKIGAWLVESLSNATPEPRVKKQKGVVMYFRGRSGHRGTRSRVRMYERIRRDPIGLPCVTFDPEDDEFTSERSLLVSAHAVWSAITRAPYEFDTESVVIWGSSLGCCSAANLCLYLMRRGTPPAALILECPVISFPKLLASRFEFLGEKVKEDIERLARAFLIHRFDLEKRIRSILNFGIGMPILVVSADNDWRVPSSQSHRIADIASALAASNALSASRRVLPLHLPVTRDELSSDRTFISVVASFIHQSLTEAKQSRAFAMEFGESPATWASDQAAEDRLFEEAADPPFGL